MPAPGSPIGGDFQAFVVSEQNGHWGTAIRVPGTAKLNVDGNAALNSVSCTAPGTCSAGGSYLDGAGTLQAFVVNQWNGRWGAAMEVPGTAKLNSGGDAAVASVSCTAPGTCGAGGTYTSGTPGLGGTHVFVVGERNGRWGTAIALSVPPK
jgi:hypothetical protein